MKRLLSLLFLLPVLASAADRIVLCGGSEVFMLDPAAGTPVKIWSWRAENHPEIPAELAKTFGTTDDCKPIENGTRLLVTSSGGGCALLELPSGKPLWWARVTSAHSIEALPGGRIVVAGSTGTNGNKLALFDRKQGDKILWESPLFSGHGVVWDEGSQRLWALGFKELQSYSLKNWEGEKPALALEKIYPLPDEGGHELRAIPKSDDLVVSTHAGVWLFNRKTSTFKAHPDLKDRPNVKSIDPHPATGRLLVVQAAGKDWWNDSFEFLHPDGKMKLEGERLYKGRWYVTD